MAAVVAAVSGSASGVPAATLVDGLRAGGGLIALPLFTAAYAVFTFSLPACCTFFALAVVWVVLPSNAFGAIDEIDSVGALAVIIVPSLFCVNRVTCTWVSHGKSDKGGEGSLVQSEVFC